MILTINLTIFYGESKVVLTAMPPPLKKLNKKQTKKLSKPWISKYILRMIRQRDFLFHKKEDPSNQHVRIAYNLFS